MNKAGVAFCLISVAFLSGCSSVDEGKRMMGHFKRMDMLSETEQATNNKNAEDTTAVTFALANYPDADVELDGKGFDARYKAMVAFLTSRGYKIVINNNINSTATIIAKVNKSMPNMDYIGVNMEQDNKKDLTRIKIVCGGNKYKAIELYHNYKKTL